MSELMLTQDTANMAELFSKLVLKSDLSSLTQVELVQYYMAVCERAGLDPMTKPFEVLQLSGKKTLYATKTAAAQLTKIHGLSVNIVDKGMQGDVYYAQARVTKKDGSSVDDLGVVSIKGLAGEALTNAMMKAITKAKRRSILSAMGVGLSDESELEDLPGAQMMRHSINTDDLAAYMIESNSMPSEDKMLLEDLRMLVAQCTTCDELTSAVQEIRNAPVLVRDALKPEVQNAQNALGCVWKDKRFVPAKKQGEA